MSLLRTSYKRRSDEDLESSDPSSGSLITSAAEKTEEDATANPKKRQASFMAQATAKLLKLTENDSNSSLHSIDIASQLLDRKQESQDPVLPSNSSRAATRSLLDLLPAAKSSSNLAKDANVIPAVSTIPETPVEPKIISQDEKIPSGNLPPPSTGIRPTKKISISPDVQFDASLLDLDSAALRKDDPKGSATSVSVGPPRPVGPSKPSIPINEHVSTSSVHVSSSTSHVGPARPRYLSHMETGSSAPIVASTPAYSTYTPSYPYDKSFGVNLDSEDVVEVNRSDLMMGPITAVSMPTAPTSSATGRLAGISRTARSKNQITYLAAVAPETERAMKEKNAERARQKRNSEFH